MFDDVALYKEYVEDTYDRVPFVDFDTWLKEHGFRTFTKTKGE